MRRISCLVFTVSIIAAFSFQTALAQFPKLPKIPKPNQPKPQPTPTTSAQPVPTNDDPSAQPRQDTGNTTKPAAVTGGEAYAKKPVATDTPLFLAETLEIRCDTQDYYWKLPKESNYTSWTPSLRFNAIYDGSARLRYKADYFTPDGSPWFSESLEQRRGDAQISSVPIVSEEVNDKDKGKAVVTGGSFGVKITNMRDNSVVFQGKFKVVRYKPQGTDARDRNLFDFYVDQDWNLPIGYTRIEWSNQDPYPLIRMWFKGGIKASDLEARVFHNGQQIATTDDGGNVDTVGERSPKRAGNDPALQWHLFEFNWYKKIIFNGDPEKRKAESRSSPCVDTLCINQTPGEYTVKVFYKGEPVRETRFSIADGNFADNGIARQSKLSTDKVLLPVKVMGTVDKWNPTAAKADAFYGNPLTGFSVP
jgi:hypothetical protein